MTRWSLFLQTLSLLHHFLGLYCGSLRRCAGGVKEGCTTALRTRWRQWRRSSPSLNQTPIKCGLSRVGIGSTRPSSVSPCVLRRDQTSWYYSRLTSEGPAILFRSNIYWQLQPLIQTDLKEAVVSLSFGAPTASAMIALRAVEGALREFYRKLTGEPFTRPWGDLTKEIEKRVEEAEPGIRPLLATLITFALFAIRPTTLIEASRNSRARES